MAETLTDAIIDELKMESERSAQNAADVAGRSFLFGRYAPMLLAERDALQKRVGELEAERDRLRHSLSLFVDRLNAYEVVRVVQVSGEDDPRGRDGSLRYRGVFTNGEMEDANRLLQKTDPDPTTEPMNGDG